MSENANVINLYDICIFLYLIQHTEGMFIKLLYMVIYYNFISVILLLKAYLSIERGI